MLEAVGRRPRDGSELCGTVGSDRPVLTACPPVVDYGADLQVRAIAALLAQVRSGVFEAFASEDSGA